MRKLEQTPRFNINAIAALMDKAERFFFWVGWGMLIGIIPLAIPLNWGNSPVPQLGWEFFIPPALGGSLGGILSLAPAHRWNWETMQMWHYIGALLGAVIGSFVNVIGAFKGEPIWLGGIFLAAAVGFLGGGFMNLFRPEECSH